MIVEIHDVKFNIVEDAVIYQSDIPNFNSDFIHHITQGDIISVLEKLGYGREKISWNCADGFVLLSDETLSSKSKVATIYSSDKNIQHTIGARGRNINYLMEEINYRSGLELKRINVETAIDSLVQII